MLKDLYNDYRDWERESRERERRVGSFEIIGIILIVFACSFISTITTLLFKFKAKTYLAEVVEISEDDAEGYFRIYYSFTVVRAEVIDGFTVVPKADVRKFQVGKSIKVLMFRNSRGYPRTTIQGYETTSGTYIFMWVFLGLVYLGYRFKKQSTR